MKAIPSIAFNEFRGTASEVTARQLNGRTVLNGRAQHSRNKTPKQSVRRANFSYITKQFRTLTEEQLTQWRDLAAAHRETALIGGGEPLTAHNLFVCLNSNRALLGVPVTKDAPENMHGSSYISYDDIWITPERLIITGLRDPDTHTARLVVKIASTDAKDVARLWGQTVIVGDFHTSDWGDIDLTEIYTEQFGVPIVTGRKYFLEMYWIDEYSGYVSEITRVASTATESVSIKGNEYVDRQKITLDDATSIEGNSVSALSIEFTSGSPFLSVNASLEGIDGYAASEVFFDESTQLPYDAVSIAAFVLARGRNGFGVQVYSVSIRKATENSQGYVFFSHSGGKYERTSDLIGGGILF